MYVSAAKFVRYVLKHMSKSVDIDGLWVAADDQNSLSKIRDALALIKSQDPRRYARMIADLEGVWVTLLPGPIGRFFYEDFICELDDRFVLSASFERIASVIVHEATHARLWRRGVRYAGDVRQRVEAVCLRQQQVFEAKLAAPAMMSEEVLALYLNQPATAWSDATYRRNHVRGSVEALRHLKMPDWLIIFFLKRRRALIQRRRRAVD